MAKAQVSLPGILSKTVLYSTSPLPPAVGVSFKVPKTGMVKIIYFLSHPWQGLTAARTDCHLRCGQRHLQLGLDLQNCVWVRAAHAACLVSSCSPWNNWSIKPPSCKAVLPAGAVSGHVALWSAKLSFWGHPGLCHSRELRTGSGQTKEKRTGQGEAEGAVWFLA